jgi:hypothetical protein
VRDAAGREWLATVEEIREAAAGSDVVVAEERVSARLAAAGVATRLRGLSVEDAIAPLARIAGEGGAMTLEDANYVRLESGIYKSREPGV